MIAHFSSEKKELLYFYLILLEAFNDFYEKND